MGGLGSPLKLSDRTLRVPLGVLQEGYSILLIGQFHCKKPHASRGCAKIIPCQAAQGQAWPKTCKTLAAGGQEGMVWLAGWLGSVKDSGLVVKLLGVGALLHKHSCSVCGWLGFPCQVKCQDNTTWCFAKRL